MKHNVLALVSLVLMTAGCDQHRVGGKAVGAVFPEPRVAGLAGAGCEGNAHRIGELVEEGADVNGLGTHSETPLFWAISCENVIGVKELLRAGANPNHAAREGQTPVTIAATYKDSSILDLLLRHGGNRDAAVTDGSSAIEIAFNAGVSNGWWSGYYLLLNAGAAPLTSNGQRTMIAHAVYSERYDKAVELLDRGHLDPNLTELARQPFLSPVGSDDLLRPRVKFLERIRSMGINTSVAKDWILQNKSNNGVKEVEKYAKDNGISI